MEWCERGVKRFRPENGVEFRETRRRHEREGAEPPNVAVHEAAPILQPEGDGDVRQRLGRKGAVVHQECSGEARLDDDPIARVEYDDYGFGAAIASLAARAADASRQCRGSGVAKNIRST